LKNLAKILIKAQKDVFSKAVGDNATPLKGDGYDFVELREYESGDDIRHIDWIISSKIGRPYVKLFTQERELNIVIAPIMSASLFFGTTQLKQDLVTEICALLSYSCVKQNDPFESYICSDGVALCTPRSKAQDAVREFGQKLDSFDLLGKSIKYEKIMQGLYQKLSKSSMVFLIGDFFETESLNLKALSMKHEVIVIIVRDKFEENPQSIGKVDIIDPDSLELSSVDFTKQTTQAYVTKLHNADKVFEAGLRVAGVKFVKIYTDENPSRKIISLMSP